MNALSSGARLSSFFRYVAFTTTKAFDRSSARGLLYPYRSIRRHSDTGLWRTDSEVRLEAVENIPILRIRKLLATGMVRLDTG